MTNTSINDTPHVDEGMFVNNVYVVIAEYDPHADGGDNRDVKVLTSLTDAELHVHDMIEGFDAKRIRAYRVFADPEGGQLHEDIGLNFDAAEEC